MNLNFNSLSARLYRWFYNKEVMPDNLCPYFWKLVLMWLLILPYVGLTLPVQITTKFRQKSISETIAYTTIFTIITFLSGVILILPIYMIIGSGNRMIDTFLPGSLIAWGAILSFGLVSFIAYLVEKYKERKNGNKMYDEYGEVFYGYDSSGFRIYYPTKKPNILFEFVKAKYNKYCPKITWNNKH